MRVIRKNSLKIVSEENVFFVPLSTVHINTSWFCTVNEMAVVEAFPIKHTE